MRPTDAETREVCSALLGAHPVPLWDAATDAREAALDARAERLEDLDAENRALRLLAALLGIALAASLVGLVMLGVTR